MKTFRKKRYKKCYSKCELLNCGLELNKKYNKEIKGYQLQLEKLTVLTNFLKGNEKIIFYSDEKDNITFVTVEVDMTNSDISKFSMDFYAYIFEYNKIKKVQTLNTYVYKAVTGNYSVEIIDFIGKINQGYGSLVMFQFLKYIRILPVKSVRGFLSDVDLNRDNNHKELLLHFYKKFGFEITEDYKISLILS